MMRILICISLMFAGSANLSAKILDIRELNTEQIEQLDRARTALLITVGILEEHGPYLPSYSDVYQSDFVATRVADSQGREFASRIRECSPRRLPRSQMRHHAVNV